MVNHVDIKGMQPQYLRFATEVRTCIMAVSCSNYTFPKQCTLPELIEGMRASKPAPLLVNYGYYNVLGLPKLITTGVRDLQEHVFRTIYEEALKLEQHEIRLQVFRMILSGVAR